MSRGAEGKPDRVAFVCRQVEGGGNEIFHVLEEDEYPKNGTAEAARRSPFRDRDPVRRPRREGKPDNLGDLAQVACPCRVRSDTRLIGVKALPAMDDASNPPFPKAWHAQPWPVQEGSP